MEKYEIFKGRHYVAGFSEGETTRHGKKFTVETAIQEFREYVSHQFNQGVILDGLQFRLTICAERTQIPPIKEKEVLDKNVEDEIVKFETEQAIKLRKIFDPNPQR